MNSSKLVFVDLIVPIPFSKLCLGPESYMVFDSRFIFVANENCNDVESMVNTADPKYLSIYFRGSSDLPLFSKINGRDHRCESLGTAGLNFDETESFIIQCDQIDLAGDLSAYAVSPNRYPKIRRYQTEPLFDKKLCSEMLAGKP